MNEQALNYCTQAIESLTERAKGLQGISPLTAANIQNVIGLLNDAIKFYIPDNGRLFDDNLRALPAVFRLPYPVVAAEFRITKEAPQSHQPMAASEEGVALSSKRIALAVEINEKNVHRFEWLVPSAKTYLLGDDGAIAIIPVYFNDEQGDWQLPPFGSLTPCRKIGTNPTAVSLSKSIYGRCPAEWCKS